MRKVNILFILFVSLLFMLGCGDSNKQENDNGSQTVGADGGKKTRLTQEEKDNNNATELKIAFNRMKEIKPVRSKSFMSHNEGSGMKNAAFSPDGKLFATVSTGDEVRIWNVKDWSLVSVIPRDETISDLCFSPDSKYIYLGGGGPGLALNARFDVKTGKLDKKYVGDKAGLSWLRLSPDGKTMYTSDYYNDITCKWNTETGELQESFDRNNGYRRLEYSPDGKMLVRETEESFIIEYPLEKDKGAEKMNVGKIGSFVFTADSKYIISVKAEDRDYLNDETKFKLSMKEISKGCAEVAKGQLVSKYGLAAIAVSPDNKYLIIGGRKDNAYFLSVPEFKVIKEVIFPHGTQDNPIEKITFSQDGKVVALIQNYGKYPHFFRVGQFEKVDLFEGHNGSIQHIFLLDNGKTIKTVGSDNAVCIWDARTMMIHKKISLPEGYTVKSIREQDGKYAVCYDSKTIEKFNYYYDFDCPAIVVDTDTGKVISKMTLSAGIFGRDTRFYWLNGHEALLVRDKLYYKFDYIKGTIIKKTAVDHWSTYNDEGYLTEDKKSIFVFSGGGKDSTVEAEKIDIDTGQVSMIGKNELTNFTGNARGVVPGGKYFYIADPGMYIYDMKTIKLVAEKEFKDVDLLSIAFNSDGSRYAVVTGGRIYVDGSLNFYDPKTQSIIRIQDTLTGETLFAFASSTRWAKVQFSPDDKKLIVKNDNDTIETWNLPEIKP